MALVVTDARRETEEPWLVFTGDSLLVGRRRSDLICTRRGDPAPLAAEQFASMRRLLELPDHVLVYPSHYGGSVCGRGLSGNPFSTIGFERRHNRRPAPRRSGVVCRGAARRRSTSARGPGGHRRREPQRAHAPAGVSGEIRLGLRANAGQFALLVAINALVGAMAGLERSVLPLIGETSFGVESNVAVLSFVAAFGLTKACANLAAGRLADRVGRKRLLVLGWLLALPVAPLVALAPSWWWVAVANLFLGASQGLAWSMTVVMKIDLVGPRRRGLALGLNESAGYLGVADGRDGNRCAGGDVRAADRRLGRRALALALARGGCLGALRARHGGPCRARAEDTEVTLHRARCILSCEQAGFVNNLNDALAWGLVPLYLAANGASVGEIGVVAAVYPAVWGLGQLASGLALRSRRTQAADRGGDAGAGGGTGRPRSRWRLGRPGVRRCSRAARRGDGARLPDAHRGGVRCRATRGCARRLSVATASGVTWGWSPVPSSPVSLPMPSGTVPRSGSWRLLTAASGIVVAATRWEAAPRGAVSVGLPDG